METRNQIYRLKTDLEKIVGKSISFEQVIKILLATKPLEETIADLMIG